MVNLDNVSTQLLMTTIPIWIKKQDGSTSQGTAFIYNQQTSGGVVPFAVTNRHTLENSSEALLEFREYIPSIDGFRGVKISFSDSLEKYFDEEYDLAAMPIGNLINKLYAENKPLVYRGVTSALIPSAEEQQGYSAYEDIFFVGYPRGLYDSHNIMPICRTGITASPLWNNFEGKPVFVIDAGVYPGSSGSPVFMLNQGMHKEGNDLLIGGTRCRFLGVVSKFFGEGDKSAPQYLGLGTAIKAECVKRLVDRITHEIVPAS